MLDNKTIGKRFEDLRKSKKDRYGKEMPGIQMAQELLNTHCITNYSVDVIRQEIGKVEKGKFPQLFLIEGYSKYFNVTSDYLLGLRETKTVDENIAMISRVTRLSEDAINKIISFRNTVNEVYLNVILGSDAINHILSAFKCYCDMPFTDLKLHYTGSEPKNVTDFEKKVYFKNVAMEYVKTAFDIVYSDDNVFHLNSDLMSYNLYVSTFDIMLNNPLHPFDEHIDLCQKVINDIEKKNDIPFKKQLIDVLNEKLQNYTNQNKGSDD